MGIFSALLDSAYWAASGFFYAPMRPGIIKEVPTSGKGRQPGKDHPALLRVQAA